MKSPVISTELKEQEWMLFGSFLRDQEASQLLSIVNTPLSDADQAHMEAFFQKSEVNHRNLINKVITHEARQRFLKTTLPKALRFVAIFIAIITVSFGIALAAIPELREYVAKLFMWTTPKYTGISMEPVNPDDNSLPVITEQVLMPEKNTTIQPPADSSESLMPEGWTGKYILTNLPDTTVITGYEVGSISVVCYRINPSSPGWDISYNEYPGQEYVYIDTEDAVFSTHVINGWTATAAVKDDLVSLWWNDEDTMFVLQGQHMDLSEVKNYAQHIVPVN